MFEFDLPGARVVFTTRSGGISEGPYESRNLGVFTEDDQTAVRRNIDQLCEELELGELQLLRQVHDAHVEDFSSGASSRTPIADGATTTARGSAVLITGADCPTVVLASEERMTALHCGWRPVAAGLIEAAARDFEAQSFQAVVGPGICMDHFEVGPEVIDAMGESGERYSNGRQLDLAAVIDHRLKSAGASRVHRIDRCTYCEPELFFSHRRDGGVTGRQGGVAWRI